ncbi:MAG: hypothetical protein KDB21_08150 [Acidimicrobiales bacterium]|nr:hypothetical protein [Acidimicrobiales bacterium]
MKRRHPLIVLVLLLAAVLAACSASTNLTATEDVSTTDGGTLDGGTSGAVGSQPGGGEPIGEFTPQTLRAIAEQSLTTTSGRAEMVMDMSVSGIPDLPSGFDLTLAFSSEWDGAGNQRAVLDMSSMGDMMDEMLQASGEDVPPGMSGIFDAFDQPIEVLEVDGQVYMSSGYFNALLTLLPLGDPVDTPWMSIDPSVYGSSDSNDVFGADPEMARSFIQFLRGAGDVVDLGDEELRGTTVNHLQATVTFGALIEAAGSEAERAELEDLWAELGTGGGVGPGSFGDIPLTIEVWIDDTGILHRESVHLELADMMAALDTTGDLPPGADMTMDFVVDFFDFGADITVNAPPPGEVTDATDLFEQLGSMGGF